MSTEQTYVVTVRFGKSFEVTGSSLSDAKRKAVDHARANGLSRDLVKIEPKRGYEPCVA